ncbi:MAG: endopeptidase La [Dehalococcoidia bacterium]|nr:endopeptidase La [Dehalococcoidia bacterium]
MCSQSRNLAEFPLLPLKNVVIFPRTIITLIVGREKSIRAVEDAASRDNRVVVAAQRSIDMEDPSPADLFTMGTLSEIVQVHKQPDGNVQVVVEGIRRVSIERFIQTKTSYRVQVMDMAERPDSGPQLDALVRQVTEMFENYAKLNRNIPPDATESISKVDTAGRLADVLAAHLPVDIAAKQTILETLNHQQRLEKVSTYLHNEIEILEMEQRLRSRVRQQMDRNQREYYLKEQLKAIHEELGNDQVSEVADLKQRLKDKALPEAVEVKMLHELARLERMPQASPEGNVIRTYLDLVLALPWNERTEDRIDIDIAQEILDEDHYGLGKVKERIVEFLAVRQLVANSGNPATKGPILCFVGPPGVGKTSLGRSIARALNRKFVRLSLGGVRDEAEIRGHRRTYVGALPGRILQSMRTAGTRNPVIMLDEIDKMSADFRGDPSAALLEVLDPEQNYSFVDHYLDVPYDLSEVMFITTANVPWQIPRPLLDRMEVIEIQGYMEEEKLQIGKRFLLPKQLEQHGLTTDNLELSDAVMRSLIRLYTREAGVRNLERAIAAVCRKAAHKVVKDGSAKPKVTPKSLSDYLGPPKHRHRGAIEESEIGVATGLAWTEHGGEILPVEVAIMHGRGNLTITGRLGDVMQESARAALSYARSRADMLHIERDFQDKLDLHIHLPEGAIPKDGPSAGITMAVALISAVTKRPVRNDLAMTGEITLRGRVLPIGGLKEKALAAHRAGIKTIIAPEENKRDLTEIPKKIRDQMEFIWVTNMDQVLAAVFVDGRGPNWLESTPDTPVIIDTLVPSLPAADVTASIVDHAVE